jgi:hypothetical protein
LQRQQAQTAKKDGEGPGAHGLCPFTAGGAEKAPPWQGLSALSSVFALWGYGAKRRIALASSAALHTCSDVMAKPPVARKIKMKRHYYPNPPAVNLSSNTFVKVPIVLQYDQTPLISILRDPALGYTTEVSVYHEDGTHLGQVVGTSVLSSAAGVQCGLKILVLPQVTVCRSANRIVFEIHHEKGDAFRAAAELHTPSGYLVRCADQAAVQLVNRAGTAVPLGGHKVRNCVFRGSKIGLLLHANGHVSVGVD